MAIFIFGKIRFTHRIFKIIQINFVVKFPAMSITNPIKDSTQYEFHTPWDEGPRKAFNDLVTSGRLKPGHAIELGSGTGRNAIFMAKHGFEVTAIDCNIATLALARRRAMLAHVAVKFVQDNITSLQNISGVFDVLVDYSTLDDLSCEERDEYVRNILQLTRSGSQFFLYCLEWTLSWWEKFTLRLLSRYGFGQLTLEPGEVTRLFGQHFYINQIAGETKEYGYPRKYAVYLMVRKPVLSRTAPAPSGG
jgi:cyclopropane fatty-acyl-phospholipid synthase-like methyltransferase